MADKEITVDEVKKIIAHFELRCRDEIAAKELLIDLDRLLKVVPQEGAVWALKGLCLSKMGKNEEAILCLDKSIAFNPERYEPLYKKAECLGMLGRYIEAVDYFKKALDLNPKDAGIAFIISLCYYLSGNEDYSASWFQKAMELDAYKTVELLQGYSETFFLSNPSKTQEEKIAMQKRLNNLFEFARGEKGEAEAGKPALKEEKPEFGVPLEEREEMKR
ncbi:MAG: tetratricopeptide repeat protein [Candidatus Micrarchaeota archaeon]